MPWIQSHIKKIDGLFTPPPPPLTSSSSSGSKISPTVLLIIVILAVIFFIYILFHLLIRFLSKQRSSPSISESTSYHPNMPGSDDFQIQLQELFHLHDSGLDQASIDALPVFLYKQIVGLKKEPFDCAVCLCEYKENEMLRLLPLCTHAFHINCIDTWLISNSSCPLCRRTLFTHGFCDTSFDLGGPKPEEGSSSGLEPSIVEVVTSIQKPDLDDIVDEKKVFSVRLGKFSNKNDGEGGEKREGETSTSSDLGARRCYSMGSFQYVVANSDLQVVVCPKKDKGRVGGQNGNFSVDGGEDGKRIGIGSKGESFSVSKIWLWPKKGKFPSSSDTHRLTSSVNVSLPWTADKTQTT
ncbi:RING-type E3 ubiquitin transferase [Sarracenia purpurea var. burkii]